MPPYLPSVFLWHSNSQLRPPHNTNIYFPLWGWRQDLLSPFLPFQIQARQTSSAVSSRPLSLPLSHPPHLTHLLLLVLIAVGPTHPLPSASCLSASQCESRCASFLTPSAVCLASECCCASFSPVFPSFYVRASHHPHQHHLCKDIWSRVMVGTGKHGGQIRNTSQDTYIHTQN